MGQEHAASLKGNPMCRLLSDAETAEIAFLMEARHVRARQELYQDGDPSDGLYLVVAGEFEMMKKGAQRERELARLGPGAIFGAISLLTRDVRTVTARARVDSSVLLLPAQGFQALVRAGSPAALKMVAGIAEVVAQRLASTNAKLVQLADQVEAAESAPSKERDHQFLELQRALQVLSF
jgi:CRP-like cAMP-binding protein